MSVDDILTSYHDEYRRSFSESDSGEDASRTRFKVIITDEGRQQIDAALRDHIAHARIWPASPASCSIRCVPKAFAHL